MRTLVSDNQSSDGTAQVLQRFAAEPKVTLVRQRNISRARHFNDCLGRIATEYYMLLCHDDYFASPAALRLAREVLASEKDVSAIYCDLLYIDAGRRPIATRRSRGPAASTCMPRLAIRS